ncbi:MAG TPA: hypothetical protein VMF61_00885 [Candidatus Acidoferrales bacterium]|nr:hypothetical protein [Candidatus Acidoferrales bacterium]
MRWLTTTAIALLAAVSIAACSNSSNSAASDNASADNSASMATSAAASTEPAASSGGMEAENGGSVPSYPGATTQAAGSSSMNMGGGMASGKVLTTDDSFDKVYAWYQQNMPAGSEKAHTTTPVQSAVFTVGEAGKDQQSVTISVSGGKTMITIAHVKQQ